MSSSQSRYRPRWDSGWIRTRPSRTAAAAGRGELVHAHEPLQRDERLDPRARAVRERHGVRVGLARAEQAARVERRPRRARGPPPPPARRSRRPPSVMRPSSPMTRELGQPVAAADLEVVRVVPGRDLQRAGAEVGLDVVVGDDRQLAPDERQDRGAPDERRGSARRPGSPRRRRRRASSRGAPWPRRPRRAPSSQRVGDRVERVLHLAVLDLEVADRRAAARVPVDEVVVAVDVALAVAGRRRPSAPPAT